MTELHSFGFIFSTVMIFFPYLTTPLSMGCCLLLMTLLMAATGGFMYCHMWLSYTLVLVFLGGLLVIFIYVALVASNEQFSLTLKPFLYMFLSLPAFIWWNKEFVSNNEHKTYVDFSTLKMDWLDKIYSSDYYLMTLFLVIYLFLTLIVIVANTKTTKMTLRSF